MSTIAAVATPLAVGGISVIRISGDDAFRIASSVFQPFADKTVEKMDGYTCAYGKIIKDGKEIDDGVITVFRESKSYTGENVCEISCHGGVFITKKVLSACIQNGAVPAEAGEFTKRAFLNGKLSLTQAEAIMDMINAQGEQASKVAVSAHEGALFKNIREITKKLVAILGELAAWVDYPEEDLPEIEESHLNETLTGIHKELSGLISSYDSGRIIRNGIDTVILGKPNVGKSTLMNMLLGYDRSIVTDIAGTTRDVVEETVNLGELVLKLSDTAGLHNTDDVVEGVGVNLAYKKLNEADLCIAVFDNSEEISEEDRNLIEKLEGKHCVAVINKSDLDNKLDKEYLSTHFKEVVEISAKEKTGRKELEDALTRIFRLADFDTSAPLIANERQRGCVINADKNIDRAISDLSAGETYDAITVLIDEAASSLLELSGEKATEAVVNEVFSKFCVGK